MFWHNFVHSRNIIMLCGYIQKDIFTPAMNVAFGMG